MRAYKVKELDAPESKHTVFVELNLMGKHYTLKVDRTLNQKK